MSLNAPLFYVIPEETVQVAQAAFPKGNRYLRVRDTFGPRFENPAFAHLFSDTGQPAEDPARLALVTILQFAERLSDAQAADADLPHPITNVETMIATTPDDTVTTQIHASLKQRDLLPGVHLTDMGSIDAELLVESERRYQLDLLGPVRGDYRRQGQEDKGFAAADFAIEWEAQQARCPAGCTSINRNPTIDLRENPVIRIKFAMRDCQACAHRSDCTDGKRRCKGPSGKPVSAAIISRRLYLARRSDWVIDPILM